MKATKKPTNIKKAPDKEMFTIHYTDNARCMNRGGGSDYIGEYEFEGTLQEVLNFGAYSMDCALGDLDEDEFVAAVKEGEWETLSVEAAKASMDEADIGAGSPVVFWIKNSKGRKVYDSGLDESDWDEEEEW